MSVELLTTSLNHKIFHCFQMLIFYTCADTELYLDPSYNTAPQGWTAQEI